MVKYLFSALLALSLLAGFVRAEPIAFDSTDTVPFWSPSLPDNGVGGAMLRVLSEAAGVKFSINYLPVKRFMNSQSVYLVGDPDILVNHKNRAILPIGFFRSAFFYYKPHHEVIEFHRIKDLQGHTLGVLRGTMEDKNIFIENGVKVEESDSVESLIRKLKAGRIDLCILVSLTGEPVIKRLFPDEVDKFIQVNIPASIRPITIMIDMDDPEGVVIAERYRNVLVDTMQGARYREVLEGFYGKGRIPADRAEIMERFLKIYTMDLNK